jgi:hypothetical protein
LHTTTEEEREKKKKKKKPFRVCCSRTVWEDREMCFLVLLAFVFHQAHAGCTSGGIGPLGTVVLNASHCSSALPIDPQVFSIGNNSARLSLAFRQLYVNASVDVGLRVSARFDGQPFDAGFPQVPRLCSCDSTQSCNASSFEPTQAATGCRPGRYALRRLANATHPFICLDFRTAPTGTSTIIDLDARPSSSGQRSFNYDNTEFRQFATGWVQFNDRAELIAIALGGADLGNETDFAVWSACGPIISQRTSISNNVSVTTRDVQATIGTAQRVRGCSDNNDGNSTIGTIVLDPAICTEAMPTPPGLFENLATQENRGRGVVRFIQGVGDNRINASVHFTSAESKIVVGNGTEIPISLDLTGKVCTCTAENECRAPPGPAQLPNPCQPGSFWFNGNSGSGTKPQCLEISPTVPLPQGGNATLTNVQIRQYNATSSGTMTTYDVAQLRFDGLNLVAVAAFKLQPLPEFLFYAACGPFVSRTQSVTGQTLATAISTIGLPTFIPQFGTPPTPTSPPTPTPTSPPTTATSSAPQTSAPATSATTSTAFGAATSIPTQVAMSNVPVPQTGVPIITTVIFVPASPISEWLIAVIVVSAVVALIGAAIAVTVCVVRRNRSRDGDSEHRAASDSREMSSARYSTDYGRISLPDSNSYSQLQLGTAKPDNYDRVTAAPADDDGTFRKPYAVLPTYDAVPENVYNGPPIVAALDENV